MNARTKRMGASLIVGLAVLSCSLATTARAQATEPFLGQIMWVGFNFCPNGWAPADGSLLAISQNTALFSLLGTTYGGNGTQNFALPNLLGRVMVGAGQGPGLQNYTLGQMAGEETHTLTIAEMPAHGHALSLFAGKGNQTTSGGNYLASSAAGDRTYTTAAPNSSAGAGSVGIQGGNQPHNNMQPYLALTPCIALTGVFPSRP